MSNFKPLSPRSNTAYILAHKDEHINDIINGVLFINGLEEYITPNLRVEMFVAVKMVLDKCSKCKGTKPCSTPTNFWLDLYGDRVYIKHWFCKTGLKFIDKDKLKKLKASELQFKKVLSGKIN